MNERIRELYRRANEQVHQQACEKSKTNRPQNNTVWNEFVPLFAELIVKECADKVSGMVMRDKFDTIPQDPRSQGWNEAVAYTSKELKKHFGVEQ